MRLVRKAAFAYGRWNRSRKSELALGIADKFDVESVLLIGVSGIANEVNNIVESRLREALPYVVSSGIARDVTGWEPFVVADGRRLPFADQSFDLVYANAVVEHVGGIDDQRALVNEVARVGRAWIITTPNRWFPIEAHHHTFFSHWLASWAPHGTVTRLLGVGDLRALLPFGKVIGIPVISPTLTAIGIADAAERAAGDVK